MKKYIVTLTEDERKALSDLTVKGKQKEHAQSIEYHIGNRPENIFS
jgi:hypothetical protein